MGRLNHNSTGYGAAIDTVTAPAPVLTVDGLSVTAHPRGELKRTILFDVSFSVARGEILGILGESGAGKTTIGRALLGLLPKDFRFEHGSIELHGRDLLSMTDEELRSTRGGRISIIFQDLSSLNPVMRAEDQVFRVIRAHRDCNRSECRASARTILERVGLREQRFWSAYPHQLSGGQKKRVAIAQALACDPGLLIADEPTASLDSASTAELLVVIDELKRQGMAVILISHDPEVLARLADRVMILYGGEIVEAGFTQLVLKFPLHPYTAALLACQSPIAEERTAGTKPRWPFIPGSSNIQRVRQGCGYEGRCEKRGDVCAHAIPPLSILQQSRQVRCFVSSMEAHGN
jgi:oligopeptide/dipeptide ABC transporter ATP-binding protein